VHDRHAVASRLERRDFLAQRGEPQSLRPTGGRIGRDRRDDDHARGGAAGEHVGVGRRSQRTVDAAAAGDRDRRQQHRDGARRRHRPLRPHARGGVEHDPLAALGVDRHHAQRRRPAAAGQPARDRCHVGVFAAGRALERQPPQSASALDCGAAAGLPGARKRLERRRPIER
jgi:hypothetical protein